MSVITLQPTVGSYNEVAGLRKRLRLLPPKPPNRYEAPISRRATI